MANQVFRMLVAAGLVLAATILPAQSQQQGLTFELGAPEPDPGREWTLMVYLDGDNDLEQFALGDFNEIEAGLPDQGVEVVVLFDRAQGYDESDGDWTDARIYRVRHDNDPGRIASEELARPGELNMGDPETLSAFVSASIARFPARQYALVLWDHGGGWRLMSLDFDAPGTEQGEDDLDLAEVGQGLRAGLDAAGITKISIVGFDMCLMAQMETAYELRDMADVLVASQAVEPGDGWPYAEILPAFARGTLGPRRLGAEIVDAYGAFYDAAGESVATLSAVDLTQVGRLDGALEALVASLDASVPDYWSELSRSVFYSESYAQRTDMRYEKEALQSVDLLDMLKRMHNAIPDFPAEAEYRDMVAAMDYAIIGNYHSMRHRLSNGLAIYAPVSGALMNEAYERTAFAQHSAWPGLLADLHQAQAENLSRPEITDLRVVDTQTGETVAGGKPGGGFGIEATVTGRNVLWVESLHALWDEENNGHLILEKSYIFDKDFYKKRADAIADVVDLMMPEFRGDRNVVSQEFVGRRFYVANGETAVLATIDASSLSDLRSVSTPVLFARGEEEYFATIYFDLFTWQPYAVVVEIPQPDGGVAYRQVEPQADDRVTMLFEFIPAEGGETSYLKGEEMAWGSGLELLIGEDQPGEVVFAVRAESIGGLSAFRGTKIKIEPFNQQEQAFYDGAKALKPENLLGTWRWNGLIEGSWKPLPLRTEIRQWENDPSVLVAMTTSDEDPTFKLGPSETILDTRLTPTLRMIRYDDEGYPAEMDTYTLLVSRWEGNSPRILLKQMVPAGWLILWSREGEAPVPQPAPAAPQAPAAPGPPGGTIQPAPQPQPQPQPPQPAPQGALSLAGIWQGPDGMVLAMDGANYEYYEYGEMVDMGSYQIVGNVMVTIDFYGDRYDYVIEGAANWFALTDEDGNRYVFQRLQ